MLRPPAGLLSTNSKRRLRRLVLLPTGVGQVLFLRAEPTEQWRGLFESYVAAAKKAGDPVQMVTLKGCSHFDGINPQSADWETVMDSVQSMLSVH